MVTTVVHRDFIGIGLLCAVSLGELNLEYGKCSSTSLIGGEIVRYGSFILVSNR